MKVCISCQKDVEGKTAVPIKEDRVIKTIRAIKKALGVAQNNQLFVCEADVKAHLERRRGFERSMLLAAVLAGVIIILLLSTLVLSGKFDLWSFFAGILLSLVILAFPLFRYAPALEGMPVKAFGKQAPPPEPLRKEGPAKAEAKPKPEERAERQKPRKKKEVS